MHPSGPVPAVELTAHTRCRSTNEAVARSPSVLLSYCLTSHQRTVDANVSHIFHASVSICSTAFQTRQHLGYVDAQAKTLRVLVIRRTLSCASRPASPNVAPLIRTQARYSEPGRPRPRTEQTAHMRNRKPTRVVSEVEDCEKLGVGRVSRSGYQHASG